MRRSAIKTAIQAVLAVAAFAANAARCQEVVQSVDPSFDPSGAKRFLAESGEALTLYGSRRFDPLYEPGRAPPPTDPDTGWPVDDWAAPFFPVGFVGYSSYGYRYSPYGYGYYRSLYRPWYVPYGYGYGWGYRYPFGAYAWSPYRYGYRSPWNTYSYYRPWYGYQPFESYSPYFDYGPPLIDRGAVIGPPADYGGCFYW